MICLSTYLFSLFLCCAKGCDGYDNCNRGNYSGKPFPNAGGSALGAVADSPARERGGDQSSNEYQHSTEQEAKQDRAPSIGGRCFIAICDATAFHVVAPYWRD